MIRVFTASYCPWCKKAVDLLVTRGVSFSVVDVTNDEQTRFSITTLSGCRTVPQVWVDDKFIGGYTDIEKLDREGTLSKTLGVEE